jgi:hypothetical protein|tara:strand:- start:473 stop:634 length:162 start_codon:yes stop_codon:yes gene_type:complete
MKNLTGSQLGNYVIHGMLIAQLFALIFIQLKQSNPKFECELTEFDTIACATDQ